MPSETIGAIWVAIACKPWNVDPRRRQSFVLRFGAADDKFFEKISPPDRFMIKS